MSARKFKAPRHGSLQYRPKRRASSIRPSIKAFPKDNGSEQCHLTAFMAYKAGMTNMVLGEEHVAKNGTRLLKDVIDAVTILEAPPMIIHGVVGYKNTVNGLQKTKEIFAEHLGEGVVRRMRYNKFTYRKTNLVRELNMGVYTLEDVAELKNTSDVIRVLVHTKVAQIPCLKQKKAHIAEIQVNGGSVSDKVDWALEKFEKEVSIDTVFSKDELVDTIGVTKGKGFQGCVKRWHVRQLPRKTNKGCRKVACIGAWHPARVMYSVARAGQCGFHRRTQQNLKVYGMGNANEPIVTEFDLTAKSVNPMGGFPKYGLIKNDYIIVKGSVTGPKKRVVTLRKPLYNKLNVKKVQVKFIDTASQLGRGRFQTSEEKKLFFGPSKADVAAAALKLNANIQ